MPSLFLCCKTKTVIWQARKRKRTIIYCLVRKTIKQNMNIFFMRLFFCYELEIDVNNVVKKKIMSLKTCYSRLLFSLLFFLIHTVRFLLDLINQYYNLLTTKFIYKAF